MSLSKLFHAAAAATLVGLASSHIVMNTPVPFGTPQTSPLDGAQFPFPCQIHGDPQIKEVTPVKAGTSTTVKFTGSAVHGGGSCQFSVNYGDPASQDPRDWHVIYTVIGGCPASAVGNLQPIGQDADGRPNGPQCGNEFGKECVRQFDVPLPAGLPNGNATFAWTWFNKIGNREMYMNCAPISISGGSEDHGDAALLKGLPPLFIANIGGKPCVTAKSGGDLNIPNPGVHGIVLEKPDPAVIGTCSPGHVVPDPHFESGGGGGGDGGSQSSSSSAPPPPPSSSSAPPATATPSTFSTMAPPPSSSSSETPASTPSASPPPPGSIPCRSVTSGFFCIDDAHFGLCDGGSAIPQRVAQGTKCDTATNQIAAII